jgi:HD-like signal output (HDOD) protein
MTTLAPNILERIKRIEVTPAIPAIMLPLLELLKGPADSVEIGEVVRLASYDNAISAQCLRVANSPLFALRRPLNLSQRR